MLQWLREKNPDIEIISVESEAFAPYGRVIRDLDTADIIKAAKEIENPSEGSSYLPTVEAFEQLPVAKTIQNRFFGTLPAQVGYCWGHSNFLNATEWHTSSEINIAVTPLVLLLGHIWQIQDGKIDSSDFRAFYLPAGTAVEVYATSLHFCPCEVEAGGFGCVVALPAGTNTNLEEAVEDKLLFRKNKWIICCEDNQDLIQRGVVSGITGCNYEIKY